MNGDSAMSLPIGVILSQMNTEKANIGTRDIIVQTLEYESKAPVERIREAKSKSQSTKEIEALETALHRPRHC